MGRVDPLHLVDEEPTPGCELGHPRSNRRRRVRDVRQEETAVDEVGGCSRKRDGRRVMSNERHAGSELPGGELEERRRRVDADGVLRAGRLGQQTGRRAGAATQVQGHAG
jgi:hypothetical protein